MATAITGITEIRGTVSVTPSAEALGKPAARTDISSGFMRRVKAETPPNKQQLKLAALKAGKSI